MAQILSLKLQTFGSALILMQLIGNEKCIPARVVRSSEYISQIVECTLFLFVFAFCFLYFLNSTNVSLANLFR